ncbi:MAG: Gfo/Idh/MocA family protein [Verrucomicrobiota bacterium]
MKKSEFPQIKVTRRTFLGRAAAMGALAGLPAWVLEEGSAAAATVKNPNDQPAIGLIGCGGRGTYVASEAAKFGRVIAVCDVDDGHAEQASKKFNGAKKYHDFRDLLEKEKVDVIVNGTPDHWHTLVNLAAVHHGKDVYSEKPLTLTIDEGKHLVEEVRRAKRVLQTGSQQRSDARFRLACELVRNGRLGKLQEVITVLPKGPHGGPFASAPVPKELDWNLWQGQTHEVEYVPQRCHGSFRYWLDYSGGTMTDWGAHHNDIALWGMGLDHSGPATIEGRQLVEPIKGGFDAPSEYEVHYTYANGVRHRCISNNDQPNGAPPSQRPEGEMENGVKFIGPEGWIFVTRGKITASKPELLKEPLPANAIRLYKSDDHMGNFFDCVRSRKDPVCDVEIGHRSVSVCHLGVLAIRLGRKLRWNPEEQKFIGDDEANGYLARPMRKPYNYEYAA